MSKTVIKTTPAFVFAVLPLFALGFSNVVNSQIPGGAFTDVKLVPNVNTAETWELLPYISPNGLELYLSRGPTGAANIWVARRESTQVDFGEPVMLPAPINSHAVETSSRLSDDGLTMFFNSNRQDADNFNVFIATRKSVDDDWDFIEPLESINSEFDEFSPFVAADGLYFTSERPGTGYRDLYLAPNGSAPGEFGDARELTNLNSTQDDTAPTLSSDGLFLFYSDWIYSPGVRRGGLGRVDIWFSRRSSISDEFVAVTNLEKPINSDWDDANLNVSPDWPADGSIVYFASNRFTENGEDFGEDANGRTNIWQATWRRDANSIGDFNLDEQKDKRDIELLGDAMGKDYDLKYRQYDLNESGTVDADDLSQMVQGVLGTWMGDANLDGVFDSADFVTVFEAAEYEDGIVNNSTWSTGDWNQDGEFDSADFVAAFRDGGYDKGPRQVNVVPEPPAYALGGLTVSILALRRTRGPRLPQ